MKKEVFRQPVKMKRFLKDNPGILFGYVDEDFVATHKKEGCKLVLQKRSLTPAQINTYNEAKRLGYFTYPKKINLAKLSKELNLAPSTVCVHLQKIMERVTNNLEI
jgi:predicted DNA binding protein